MRTGERNTFDSVVGRASALLGAFDARHLSMGVSELSRRSGLAKSTTARLAAELTEHGFLERTNGSDLKLGTKLFELGELASRQRKLREVALPYMADLRQVSRQTVHLAVLVDTEVMYVEIVRSRDAPRMPSEVGGRLPAHSAAVGKALLAFSPDSVVQAVIDGGLRPVGPRTITSPGLFCANCGGSRKPGSPTSTRNPVTAWVARPAPFSGRTGNQWMPYPFPAGTASSTSGG